MDFKPGDVVRIVDIGTNRLRHPTENRSVRNGDVITVISVHIGNDDGTPAQMMVFKPGDDGIYSRRAELVKVEFKVGDVVKILDLDGSAANVPHPTEKRNILKGDILTIANVEIGHDYNGSGSAVQLISFKKGAGGIFSRRIELVAEHSPEEEIIPECKCPTLIHGHHAGCPFA